jgi:type IV pilus assembly protein PilM
MAEAQGVWGIDVGQCALKAVRLEIIDGQVTATAFDYIEHPKILNQPDADPDQLTREALEKFLSRNSIKGDLIAMNVPGQSGLARFVKLPPVEEKKITDIVKFEAKQQIPFNLNDVVWDYQKIGSGEVTDGFAMETEIGLFAIKRDTVNKYLRHFQEVNMEVHIVQMTPLALCNFVCYDLLQKGGEGEETGKKDCVAALDIATDNANLVITDGERIIWQRPIPIGGNHFTRALTKDLKLSFAKAEHLKRNATKSPDLKKILMSLRPVLNDFVNEVHRSLGFFTNTHRDANVQFLLGMGNAFRLPGLQKFLSEKLALEVRKLQKFERLEGESVVTAPLFTENVLSFAPAYGLALQGLKLTRLQTNLLPQDIQVERLIRSKKPMAAAAAAVLLIGLGALTFGYAREHRAVAAPVIEEAKKRASKQIEEADERAKERAAQLDKIRDLEVAVKSVLAGQDERLNWALFYKFLNDRLPRPDGSNLTEAQKEVYWQSSSTAAVRGRTAWERFRDRQHGVKGSEGRPDDDVIEDLIQINVEGVDCLFTEDLQSVYTNLLGTLQKKNRNPVGMPDNQVKQPPEGKGWLVEIRGYTYHRGQIQFVLDTLVKNLNDRPYVVEEPKKTKEKSRKEDKEKKEDTELELTDKPRELPNKISHVFVYAYEAIDNPEPVPNRIVGKRPIKSLLAGVVPVKKEKEGEEPAPEGDGTAAKAAPNLRNHWQPLGGTGPEQKGSLELAAEPEPRVGDVGRGQQIRTEFVIVLAWQEPTPSDQLRPSFIKPVVETTPEPLNHPTEQPGN